MSASSSTASTSAAAASSTPAAWEEQVFHFKDAKDVFLGHKQLINTMLLVPSERRLYTGALAGRIIAYDTHDRSKVEEFRAATAVSSLVYDEGTILCAVGKLVYIVQPGTAKLQPVTRDVEPSSEVTTLGAQAGDVYVGHADGVIRWWVKGECRKQWAGKHSGAIGEIYVLPKRFYSTSVDGSALVWNRDSGSSSVLVEKSKRPLKCILEHNNFILISATSHILVHKKDGTYKTTLSGHAADVHCMVGDRELLFTGSGDRRVLLWSLVKFAPILLIDTGHSNRVKCMSLIEATLYTGSGDKTVRVFDLKEAFAQRNTWARDRRTAAPSVAQKLASVFKPKKDGAAPATLPRNGSSFDRKPKSDLSTAPSAPIAPPTVTDADLQALEMWESMMAEQAEINRQKKEAEKAQRQQQQHQPRTASPPVVASSSSSQQQQQQQQQFYAPSQPTLSRTSQASPTPFLPPPPQQQQAFYAPHAAALPPPIASSAPQSTLWQPPPPTHEQVDTRASAIVNRTGFEDPAYGDENVNYDVANPYEQNPELQQPILLHQQQQPQQQYRY